MRYLLILLITTINSCAIIDLRKEEPLGNFKIKEDILCAFDIPVEKTQVGELEVWIYNFSDKGAKMSKKTRFGGVNSRSFFTSHLSLQKYNQQFTFVFKGDNVVGWNSKGIDFFQMKKKKR